MDISLVFDQWILHLHPKRTVCWGIRIISNVLIKAQLYHWVSRRSYLCKATRCSSAIRHLRFALWVIIVQKALMRLRVVVSQDCRWWNTIVWIWLGLVCHHDALLLFLHSQEISTKATHVDIWLFGFVRTRPITFGLISIIVVIV